MCTNITIIVAVGHKGGIGVKNSLPFKSKIDMDFFKRTTTGNVVVMGHNTFKSLGNKPLRDRENIVIASSDVNYDRLKYDNVITKKTYESGMDAAINAAVVKKCDVFIIGGGSIYERAVLDPRVERILLNYISIDEDIEYDTFFPNLNDSWNIESCHTIENVSFFEIKRN